MTKKRDPLEDPPTASSSDDDEMETSGGESEEVSSSEEEEAKDPVKAPSSAVTKAFREKPTAVASAAKEASDSESGSETETDSDSETERPPPTVPASSSAEKPKKNEPYASATLALPAAKSGTKRPSQGTAKEADNSKRPKKVTFASGGEEKKIGEDSKKPAFQRLWTEEDEITVLQGMIDFKADTGNSPYEDTTAYYDFIKGSISFEVSKNQFMDKIRSLKKKYMGKEKPSFTKPHDQKSYKLSKYIWGSEGLALESAVKSNGVPKKSQKTKKLDSVKQELNLVSVAVRKPDWFENSFLVRAIAGFGVDEESVKQKWSLLPGETKKKTEEKVKVLQAKELEFVVEKTGFLHEVTSMIAEATKNKPLDM